MDSVARALLPTQECLLRRVSSRRLANIDTIARCSRQECLRHFGSATALTLSRPVAFRQRIAQTSCIRFSRPCQNSMVSALSRYPPQPGGGRISWPAKRACTFWIRRSRISRSGITELCQDAQALNCAARGRVAEVILSFAPRYFRDRSRNAHLAAQFRPIEDQGSLRIGGQFTAPLASIVRVKNEATRICLPDNHYACRLAGRPARR